MSFDLSVDKVLARHRELRWLAPALCRIPTTLEALVPAEATALLRLHADEEDPFGGGVVKALVLAFDGYNVAMCRDMMRQVEDHGRFPGWARLLLLSEKQLQAEHGVRLGRIVAQAISDPMAQPIMHAMIQMEAFPPPPNQPAPYSPVVRRSSEYTLCAPLGPGLLRKAIAEQRAARKDIVWAVQNRRPIEPHVASHHYQSVTGRRLPDEIAIRYPYQFSGS